MRIMLDTGRLRSLMGVKRTLVGGAAMSAFGGKADMICSRSDVRY
jgi:hypothetical protein